MRVFVFSLLVLIVGTLFLSCGNHQAFPTTPSDISNTQSIKNSHTLWDLGTVIITPTSENEGEAEIIPIRTAEFNSNVQHFLSPPKVPVSLIKLEFQPGTKFSEGYIDVNVGLGHPFAGFSKFRGFDVRLIIMADSTNSGIHDPSVIYAKPPMSSAITEMFVTNPDGYTRWWNAMEFTDPMKLFSFSPGKLGTDTYPHSTVNAYKYYADDLDLNESVANLDISQRGSFAATGSVNTRNIRIKFPNTPAVNFKFNYAIDASWANPDSDPPYPIESFPPDAQTQEPYHIIATDSGTDAFYIDNPSGPISGGHIRLNVEIFDWQSLANPNGVAGEITSIWLEGAPLTNPVNALSLSMKNPGSAITSSVFSIDLDSSYLNLTSSGDFWLFGTVESANPSTYMPQIDGGDAFIYPDAPLSAYFMVRIPVGNSIDPFEITKPNGGEMWTAGSSQNIEWKGGTSFSSVTLEYSKDDFVSDINIIAEDIPNTGSYKWEPVPPDNSDTVKIRVSGYGYPMYYDDSDDYFSIVESLLDRIVYAADGPAQGRQIYSIDPEGLTTPEQWTSGTEAFIECPKLSPDGRYILYTAFDWDFTSELRIIDVVTKNEVNVTPANTDGVYGDFSHDGKRIVGACGDVMSGLEIWTFDYTGGNAIQHTTGADAWAPEFSPDDKTVAYQGFMDAEIWLLDLASGNITQYTTNGTIWDDDPKFSPDGTQIAWATSYPNTGGRIIYVSPITSWDPPDFKIDFEQYIRSPCFSPDGTKIAFDHGGFDGSELGIYTIADGTWKDITSNAWGDYMCDWGVMVPH